MADPKGQQILQQVMGNIGGNSPEMEAATAGSEDGGGMMNQEMLEAMLGGMPLRQMLSFIPGINKGMLSQLVDALNS